MQSVSAELLRHGVRATVAFVRNGGANSGIGLHHSEGYWVYVSGEAWLEPKPRQERALRGPVFDRVVAGAPDDFHVQRPSAHRRNGRERADSSQKESASKEKFSGRNRGFSIGDFLSESLPFMSYMTVVIVNGI